jgi:2-oxoisovalerate dehydrogenase E1 component alpha subunit
VQVLEAFNKAEKTLRPNPEEMFHDVYDKLPKSLQKQMMEMKAHVKQYKDQYPVNAYEKME